MSLELVSFYSPLDKRFAYTGYIDEFTVLPSTNVIYDSSLNFLKPIFNEENQIWEESATEEELNSTIEEPIILAELCYKYEIPFLKDTEIQYDTLSFLKSKEAVYGLKGAKLYKDYVYVENGQETLVVRQIYSTLTETKTHEGMSVDVITGLSKKIIFYKRTQLPVEKSMSTLDFNVFPIVSQNPLTGDPILLFSSSKLEEFLQNQRYKADSMLKSFNPNLYNWLYNAYGDLYLGYLKTGNKSALVNAFNTETDTFNLNILNKIVETQFLVILFGEQDSYPEITVKDLIVLNLQ